MQTTYRPLLYFFLLFAQFTSAQWFQQLDNDTYVLRTAHKDHYIHSNGMTTVLKKSVGDSLMGTYRYDMDFVNGRAQASLEKERGAWIQYYKGDLAYRNRACKTILLKDVWPGIDVEFKSEKEGLKYDFIVHPNSDYKHIQLHFDGVDIVHLKEHSFSWLNPFEEGEIQETFPLAYCLETGKKIDFSLSLHEDLLSFYVPSHPSNQTLVIDPWCTYFGGSDIDEVYGMDVDAYNNSVITGYTYSTDLPVTPGVIDTSYETDYDAFVAKFDAMGNLMWATYFGGNGGDYGRNVRIDNDGNVYATGNTLSTNLPTTTGVFQGSNNGSYDAYLLKLNPQGQMIWNTYYGGVGGDFGLVEDLFQDRIVIAGFTSSVDLPASMGIQDTLGGALDAYIAYFDTSGTHLWSTYFGGFGSEDVHALTFDHSGNIIAAGDSHSPNLPVMNAHQANSNGSQEIYVLKLNPNGQQVFSTYYGGSSNDDVLGVTSDEQNRIYLTGFTKSTDFPLINPVQTSLGSVKDGIIMRLSPNGTPDFVSLFGGNDDEEGTAMNYVNGQVYCLMNTWSSDLPLYGVPHQSLYVNYADNYLLVMDTSLNRAYSTYFGGASSEISYACAVSPDESIFITGFTSGSDLAFGSGIFQDSIISSTDAYVLRLDGLEGHFDHVPHSKKNDLLLYPNPTSNIIKLPNSLEDELLSFQVFDLTGRCVLKGDQMKLRGGEIDLSLLRQGEYTVCLQTQRRVWYATITKI